MESILLIFIGIILLFFIVLAIKKPIEKKVKKKICAICIAISLTWISLLILYWLNLFNNAILLALLMGHTSLALYYIAEEKLKAFTFFRLPFLLSLIAIFYFLASKIFSLSLILLLLALWFLFGIIFAYKTNPKINKFVKKVVECCMRS